MSEAKSGKMVSAFAVQPGDEIALDGERQSVLRIEKPGYRTVLIYTDLTEGRSDLPHEVDSRVKIEVFSMRK